MNKEKVICIKIGKFKHHQKLKIGNQYLLQENIKSIFIYELDNTPLGFFPREFFLRIEDFRNQQLDSLSI